MRIMKLFVAAAIAVGAMSVTTAPATAQSRHTGPVPYQDARHHDNDRGRHQGWRNNRGRHRGWATRRVCQNVWRHGHRQRVCRMVRYRR